MKITIKENEYHQLDGLSNSMFQLRLRGSNLVLISVITGKEMLEVSHVEELKPYGFDISVTRKIDKEVIESIADENNLTVIYTRGQWYYNKNGSPKLLRDIAEEYGFYV